MGSFPAHLSQARDAEENMHRGRWNMELPKGGSARPRKAEADVRSPYLTLCTLLRLVRSFRLTRYLPKHFQSTCKNAISSPSSDNSRGRGSYKPQASKTNDVLQSLDSERPRRGPC